MFELSIIKIGKYRNEFFMYEYSSIFNLIEDLNNWLKTGKIKEKEIYNIRRIIDEN